MTDSSFSVDITQDELFKLLGNETRMRILRTLWEEFEFEYYVTESQTPLSFSSLRSRAGEGISNFSYHLEELTGVLVENDDDGYLLTPLGYNVMRAIDTFATFDYHTVDETALDDPCPFCGGTLEGSYRREMLEVQCRDCGGLAEDGNFTFVQVATTTADKLDLSRLLDVGIRNLEERIDSSRHGICWECHVPLERTLDCCEEHERDEAGVCPACANRYALALTVECPNCGTAGRGPLLEYAVVAPEVRAFFGEHGQHPVDIGPWRYRLAAFSAVEETALTTDPPGGTYRFAVDDQSMTVHIDQADSIELRCER